MVVYYNMSSYWQGINSSLRYIQKFKELCSNDVAYNALVYQIDHEWNEINYYNNLLFTKSSTREKRGLINGIGNIANSLFGVLDDKFAEKYETDIENININQNHLLNMLKNQTSILEAQNNIIKRNEDLMNRHFKNIHQNLYNLTKDINKIDKATQHQQLSFRILTTAFSINALLSNIHRIQETLLDTVLNIYHGQLDIHLISPSDLKNQLNIISGRLQGEVMIPSSNMRDLYQLLKVHVKTTKRFLIIEVKIPLLTHGKFELSKVISIPIQRNNKTIYNIPAMPYIAVNMKKDMVITLNDNDIQHCVTYFDQLLCYENHPIHNIHFDKSICAIRLFTENNNHTYCRPNIKQCADQWIKLQTPGAWLFSCCRECTVRILCPTALDTKQLKGNGIIYIGQNCIIKGDTFTIHVENDYMSKMFAQSNIEVPADLNYRSSINTMISSSLNSDLNLEQENHEKLFNKIQDQIDIIKTQTLQPVQYSHTYHYAAIYSIIAILLVMIIAFVIVKMKKRHCSYRVTEDDTRRNVVRVHPSDIELSPRQCSSGTSDTNEVQCVLNV
ncbi:hypothetical protein ACJJTC_017976 [Scirpophaga incertulas]